jgi:pimeloyl-ACP methyl ester carboxylesterase
MAGDRRVPVLFVHGQPGLGSDFDLVRRLLEPEFRVLAPDRPGYGENPSRPVSMQENAVVMAELLESSSPPAVVVGHSYGGGIAALLGAQRPDLVAGIVLAASVGSGEHLGRFDRLLATRVVGDILTAGGLETARTVLAMMRNRGEHAPGRIGKWIAVTFPDKTFLGSVPAWGRTARSVVFEQRALFKEIEDIEKAISNLAVPLAAVAGTWDIVVSPVVAAKIAACVPGAELLLVARTGHFLPRDAPGVLASAVRKVARRSGLAPSQPQPQLQPQPPHCR